MERPYQTIRNRHTQALVHFLTKNGQALLPMVELIEQSKLAVDEVTRRNGPSASTRTRPAAYANGSRRCSR